jgi:hypothetical protein
MMVTLSWPASMPTPFPDEHGPTPVEQEIVKPLRSKVTLSLEITMAVVSAVLTVRLPVRR